MKFNKAVDNYLHTRQFCSLSSSSQKNYECCLLAFCRMSVMGRRLGNVQLNKLTVPMCSEIYDTWELETSTSNANHNARVFSVLLDQYGFNPHTLMEECHIDDMSRYYNYADNYGNNKYWKKYM